MIAIVLGTRAELVKTFPIMLELQKRKIPYYFIHTGQHYLKKLCKDFNVKLPDVVLTKEQKATTKFYGNAIKALFWAFSLIFKIRSVLNKIKNLKYVLYHGDTMTTAAAALASSYILNPFKKYKNVHLEAGLRSGSILEPFPEEISRKIADNYSDILFAVSDLAEKNLKNENNKGKIIKIGNTILDASLISYNLAKKKKIKKISSDYALVSIHRHENIKNKKRLNKIVEIISDLPIKTYFFLYDNTKNQLIKFNLYKKLLKNKNIKLVKPASYIKFIYYLAHCKFILTDGGSIQEESLIFKKPCILLRKKTERIEGLNTGINFLSELNLNYCKNIINKILKNFRAPKFKNPYGEFGVSKKIVDFLINELKNNKN